MTTELFGIPIQTKNLLSSFNELISHLRGKNSVKTGGRVHFVNVHSLMESRNRNDLKQAFQTATWNAADGVPLQWLATLQNSPLGGRVCGPDFLRLALESSEPELQTMGFIGGAAGQATEICTRYGKTAKEHSPPFRPFDPDHAREDWAEFLRQCKGQPPRVVWVCLGAPKQELWMQEVSKVAPDVLFFGVGAAIDFFSGKKSRAPQWMQNSGLEWLHRLLTEPRRLAGRYFATNSRFLFLLALAFFKNPYLILTFLLIATLSFDTLLKLDAFGFSLRPGYVLTALWLVFNFKKVFSFLFARENRLFALGLGLMTIAAAVGTFYSENFRRSVFFSLWTLGTLAVVPFVMVPDLFRRNAAVFLGLFKLNMIFHSLVVIYDFFAARIDWSVLGNVMMYYSNSTAPLARPHAWYQEPGYFCGFMLFGILGLLVPHLTKNKTVSIPRASRFDRATLVLTSFAIILTTSRMGWLGLAWIFGVWFLFQIKSILIFFRQRPYILIGLLFAAFSASYLGRHEIRTIYDHVGQGLVKPKSDGSFIYRYARLKASLDVFSANPFFGAGPGAAGAYFLKHFPESELEKMSTGWRTDYAANDPLAQNLYTELLAEWGMIGSVGILSFFILGIASVFHFYGFIAACTLTGLVLIEFLTWQSIPRFDLWVALGLLFAKRHK